MEENNMTELSTLIDNLKERVNNEDVSEELALVARDLDTLKMADYILKKYNHASNIHERR